MSLASLKWIAFLLLFALIVTVSAGGIAGAG